MDQKWTYKKSFLTLLIVLVIGFIAQYFSGSGGVVMPSFPANLIILLLFTGYLVFTYFAFRHTDIIAVFTGIPLTIAVISAYTLLSLIMGFTAQEPHDNELVNRLGLTHIKTSYPFVLSTIFLLIILGYSIIKRLTRKLTLRNMAFFLNHAGLFLIIAAGSLGTGDLLRLSIPVNEGSITNIGVRGDNHKFAIPFHIELNQFSIDQYPPELMLYDGKTGKALLEEGGQLPFIKEGRQGKLHDLEFTVKEYYDKAVFRDSLFIESPVFGSTHAARLAVRYNGSTYSGWVSPGNFMHEARYLFIDGKYVLAALEPKVLKYQSDITIYKNQTPQVENVLVEVNKPFKYEGWTIYQHSYDARLGRWSRRSVFEVSRDPWLPVVYTGIFMMIAGALYLIYAGRMPIRRTGA